MMDLEDKIIAIGYDSLDELLFREDKIIMMLTNYIERTDNKYELADTEIVLTEDNKYKLVLKLRAI